MPSQKALWLALAMGVLSSLAALILLPRHYAFYVFGPASPGTLVGRFRLLAANSVLVAGFVAAALSALALMVTQVRRRHYWALLCPAVVLANPLHQPVYLEELDQRMNSRLLEDAKELQLVGRTAEEVERFLGEAHRYGNAEWHVGARETWEYKPMPFYWMGARLQVFFVEGKVVGFETDE